MKNLKPKKLLMIIISLVMVISIVSSGIIVFATEAAALGTVTDPSWKENSTATAQWSAVDGANYYKLEVYVYDGATFLGSCEAGTSSVEVDVQQEINKVYNEAGSTAPVVQVSYTVTSAYVLDNEWTYGEASAMSAKINYFFDERHKFTTPQNVELDENLVASWDIAATDYLADRYNIYLKIYSDDMSDSWSVSCSVNTDPSYAGGRMTFDMYDYIRSWYYWDINNFGSDALQGAKVEIQVRTESSNLGLYISSDFSSFSDPVEPNFGRIPVEEITLYPEEPIICLGNSLYLGKTVFPIDAFYRSIDWSSSDAEIVSVDEDGKITANAVGTAEITAKIGNVTETVPVTVYKVKSTTITDEEEMKDVTDQAGDIIDDILNNENPDLGNTDIPAEDLDDIKDQIQEGIERGDEFFTDLNWYEENFVKYRDNWGQIKKAARELNAQFAGAYNIEVEMYHKDKDGEKYHIGNIVELDNMITFTFDLPTGMKEIQSGEAKKFVLVRIHKNTIEPIDYTINDDGTFTARSDKYSDFIWLIVDEDGCAGGNHDMGDYVVTRESTCAAAGEEKRECSRCDYFETREIKATGHSYDNKVDGTCNACGIHRETTEMRTVMDMFRMYDPNSGEHFYTGSEVERDNLVAEGWCYEGVGFTFSMTTGAPVYRLYDPVTGEHLYTMDEEEKATLLDAGWNYEGIAFNSAYDTEVPQYRLHNPNETRGAYHFTASIEERDYLLSIGWEDQGIGFYSSWK